MRLVLMLPVSSADDDVMYLKSFDGDACPRVGEHVSVAAFDGHDATLEVVGVTWRFDLPPSVHVMLDDFELDEGQEVNLPGWEIHQE